MHPWNCTWSERYFDFSQGNSKILLQAILLDSSTINRLPTCLGAEALLQHSARVFKTYILTYFCNLPFKTCTQPEQNGDLLLHF